MKPVIDIQNLSKEYLIGRNNSYLSLRDTVSRGIKNLLSPNQQKDRFWALKDINLKVEPGQRLGIIGRNGAGKSTLLKILSRVTWPTKGEVTIRGRLASLLEVGTGFHPELTGRENIYLNGSILGLQKKEIDRQFDAIVDFSGVEKFIDTPLKNYSSGMQLRLAFAVAAHLEPEILLIDEVLAVGDLEFQKKCIGKMEEVSNKQGRTIVFVSHNMQYVSSLCNSAILLDGGSIMATGNVQDTIAAYTRKGSGNPSSIEWTINNAPGNDKVRLCRFSIINSAGNPVEQLSVAEPVGIELHYEVVTDQEVLWIGYNIHNETGLNIFDTHSVQTNYYQQPHSRGNYTATAWIPANLLNLGTYYVSCAIFNHQQNVIHLHEHQLLSFSIHEAFDKLTARGMSGGDFPGLIRPLLEWNIKPFAHEK